MEPAPLLAGVGEHLPQRPSRTRAPRHRPRAPARACRGGGTTAADRPTTRDDSRNPSASATSSLRAVGAHPDHHQQAHLVLLQADLEVDPVDPHVHVVGVRQRALGERLGLVLPLRGQPGDRRRRQARGRARGTAPTPGRSRCWTGRAGTAAAAPRPPAGTSAPTPAGSPRRTAAAHRSPASMRLSLTRGARTGTAPAAVITSRGVVVAVADHQPMPVLVDLARRGRRCRRRPRPATPPPASAGHRHGRSHRATTRPPTLFSLDASAS